MSGPARVLFTMAGFLPLIVGGLIIRAALTRARRERRVVSLGHQACATVVDNRVRRDSDGARVYTPVVELWTSTEQLVRADLAARRGPLSPGSTVDVFYDPDEPSSVVDGHPINPVLGVVFGAFFVAFGVLWVGLNLVMGTI